jgi:hypothetical protein
MHSTPPVTMNTWRTPNSAHFCATQSDNFISDMGSIRSI